MHPAIKGLAERTFLREFTFMSNQFEASKGESRELVDVFLILRSDAIAIQVKQRARRSIGNADREQRWFENKVLSCAKRQAKDSYRFVTEQPSVTVDNLAGESVTIQTNKISDLNIVILFENDILRYNYTPFYRSEQIGLIHIMNLHDWLCCLDFLYTPREVISYLGFRERVVESLAPHGASEREMFAAYIVDLRPSQFLRERRRLPQMMQEVTFEGMPQFDYIVGTFSDRVNTPTDQPHRHQILSELAELNRINRKLFVKRWNWCCQEALKMGSDVYIPPHRFMTSSGCGYTFLPVPAQRYDSRHHELGVICGLSKYDLKAERHVGLAVCPCTQGLQVDWCYGEEPWEPDAKLEAALKERTYFRPMRSALLPEYPRGQPDENDVE